MKQDIVENMRTRAKIRRQISTRKSVQEGKPDRIADVLEEAADEIERLKTAIVYATPVMQSHAGPTRLEEFLYWSGQTDE